LPPLASRMLASVGWAFGVVTLAALHRPVSRRTRLVMLMLAVYLTPLLVTAPLFHLDRFDPAAPITYVFFALVLTMTVATLWYLFEEPVIVPDEPPDSLAPTALLSGWLGLVAAVTASWGLALFVTDNGPSGLIWLWSGDLLTSRLIAVMLLTIAVGALYALRYADVSRVMLGVIGVYGFGIMLANLWNILANKPVNLSYVTAFGIMFLVSATLLIAKK
jgi:hypothetical protein